MAHPKCASGPVFLQHLPPPGDATPAFEDMIEQVRHATVLIEGHE